jgi:hypothetical protein
MNDANFSSYANPHKLSITEDDSSISRDDVEVHVACLGQMVGAAAEL